MSNSRSGTDSETSDRPHHNGTVENPDSREGMGSRSPTAAGEEIHPAQKQYAIAFGALALVLVLGFYFLRK